MQLKTEETIITVWQSYKDAEGTIRRVSLFAYIEDSRSNDDGVTYNKEYQIFDTQDGSIIESRCYMIKGEDLYEFILAETEAMKEHCGEPVETLMEHQTI